MTSSTDIGLLRFMRARTDETGVLNGLGELPVDAATPDLPARLVDAAQRMRSASVSANGHRVAYAGLSAHPAYAEYRALARRLASFDPSTLESRQARLAFWINVFNSLSIDAVIMHGLQQSIREVPGFFRRAAYTIGGWRFSVEAIEHGILRGNRPPLPRLQPPFGAADPRTALALDPPDPRVHFALNCAALSCPPFGIYTAEGVEAQLDDAAGAFIDGGGVVVEGDRVALSSIFRFYADDFGGAAGIAACVARYSGNQSHAAAVETALRRGTETYQPYDWTLNRATPPGEEPA